ncbi:MAG: hypothetical protein JW734_02010 [Candidatus Omnitrophica bacterium]|nr:hypothetical protein [Candidatus Omnitrophota bacterium]
MGKLQKNVFVLLGKEANYKKIQIDKIKGILLKEDPSLSSLNFFCDDLTLAYLQKEIENFSFTNRIFIFRNADLLSPDVKAYLLKSLKGKDSSGYFIFDFDVENIYREELEKDDFFSFLFKLNPPYKLAGKKTDFSIRDLAGALRRNSQADSVVILADLFKKNRKDKISMQILGLIIKIFSEIKEPSRRKKNLKYIFDTDRLIKEGALNPQTALEMLIFKLLKSPSAANKSFSKNRVGFVKKTAS